MLTRSKFLILTILATILFSNSGHAQKKDYTAVLEALYIYNFSTLTEWPAKAQSKLFVIGFIGNDSLTTAVRNEIASRYEGKKINQSTIKIKQFSNIDDIKSCKFLYISPQYRNKLSRINLKLKKSPTLTIGHSFPFNSVTFNFVVTTNRSIKFALNQKKVNIDGIKFSDRLVNLAYVTTKSDKKINRTVSKKNKKDSPKILTSKEEWDKTLEALESKVESNFRNIKKEEIQALVKEFKKQKADIESSKLVLEEMTKTIVQDKAFIDSLENTLITKSNQLDGLIDSLVTKEEELVMTTTRIAEKSKHIKHQEKVLENANIELGSKKEKIVLMEQNLSFKTANLESISDQIIEKEKEFDELIEQKEITIENQNEIQRLSYWAILFVVVIAIAIFRNYQIKKKNEEVLTAQKLELENAHKEISHAHKEITDSIDYAKRIQNAILPPLKLVKEYLNDSFILYKPKDVIAGDFYWMEEQNKSILFASADCTGHGVPGAMVSVVCHNAMNRAVREYKISDPGKILDKVREIVIEEFEKSDEDVKDGMDIALCSLKGNKLKYAGAHNPLWIIRNGEILETKANKEPIGKFHHQTPFTTHEFELEKGDAIYIFSDGIVDQFGGEKEKKFKPAKLRKLLLEIQEQSLTEQRITIDKAFENWKGEHEQVDDVCMIGVRIS